MANLENRPKNLMFLLSLVRRILGIFHLIAEFQQGIFYVVEACWWGFAIAGSCADGRHGGECSWWLKQREEQEIRRKEAEADQNKRRKIKSKVLKLSTVGIERTRKPR
jgi:hypothetical protein